MAGHLVLCATPIGNLGDASPRLAETLAGADAVYAEDTRRSAKLLRALGVEANLESFFVGNQRRRSEQLTRHLEDGLTVALITDAGTPAVSDPGRLAVAAARSVDATVTVVPGPSAVTAAVAISGMVDGRFVFEGFPERKGRRRSDQLQALASETRPVVMFLSPHRVPADLADLAEACGGERQVCVARELTKLHEEVWWGSLSEAMSKWSVEPPRGEFTVVIAGVAPSPPDLGEAVRRARDLMEQGHSASQAARQAAAETGTSRREIYQALVEDKA